MVSLPFDYLLATFWILVTMSQLILTTRLYPSDSGTRRDRDSTLAQPLKSVSPYPLYDILPQVPTKQRLGFSVGGLKFCIWLFGFGIFWMMFINLVGGKDSANGSMTRKYRDIRQTNFSAGTSCWQWGNSRRFVIPSNIPQRKKAGQTGFTGNKVMLKSLNRQVQWLPTRRRFKVTLPNQIDHVNYLWVSLQK